MTRSRRSRSLDTVWRNKYEAVETDSTSYAGNFIVRADPSGALSIYVTGNRSLNNAAETYGRQLENGKTLLEQFWDNSKYEQMSETGKKAYMGFQFQRCCGAGMALIDKKSNAAIENLTDYEVVGIENLA